TELHQARADNDSRDKQGHSPQINSYSSHDASSTSRILTNHTPNSPGHATLFCRWRAIRRARVSGERPQVSPTQNVGDDLSYKFAEVIPQRRGAKARDPQSRGRPQDGACERSHPQELI